MYEKSVYPDRKNSAEILQALKSRLKEFGITRLAETTGLDRIGIHTSSCVCPGTKDSIWVYSGKGISQEQAHISAIMECIERTSALWRDDIIVNGKRDELSGEHEIWGPEHFTEYPVTFHYEIDKWVRAKKLDTAEVVLVPAQSVFLGYPFYHEQYSVGNSNGLGAGFSNRDALVHAICELIERDVVSVGSVKASHYAKSYLAIISRLFNVDDSTWAESFSDDSSFAVAIDPSTLNPEALRLYNCYATSGLDVKIKYLKNEFNIPVMSAACVEMLSKDNHLGTCGFGIDFDPDVATLKALLELAQSRATDLQGAREDCGVEEKSRHSSFPKGHWLLESNAAMSKFSDLQFDRISGEAALETLVKKLAVAGLDKIAFVELPSYDNIHVVKALIPGIETWHATAGNSKLGPRLKNL